MAAGLELSLARWPRARILEDEMTKSRGVLRQLIALVVLLGMAPAAMASSGGGIVFLAGGDRFPEQSCTQCHPGAPSDHPATTIEVLASGVPLSEYSYTPGETVSLVMKFADPRARSLGFLVIARSDHPDVDGSGNHCGTGGQMAPGASSAGADVKVRNGEFITVKPQPCGDRINGIWWATHTRPIPGSAATWEVSWTFPAEDVGPITVLFVVNASNADGSSSNDNIVTQRFTVRPLGSREAPEISGTGLGLGAAAGGLPQAAPGSIASVRGTGFVGTGVVPTATVDASGMLSRVLRGSCVEVGALRAPLLQVLPKRVTFQIPAEAGLGASTLRVVRDCGTLEASASEALAFHVVAVRPVFLQFDGTAGIAAVRPGMALVAPVGSVQGRRTRPAVAGDIVSFFGTGFGPSEPAFADGEVASGLRTLATSDLRVMVGSLELEAGNLHYAGAAPHFAGLQQLMVEVPAQVPEGSHSVSLMLDGAVSEQGPMLWVATAESLLPAVNCTVGLTLSAPGRCRASFGEDLGILEVDSEGRACVLGSIVNDTEGWVCGAESLDLSRYGAAIRKEGNGTWTITEVAAVDPEP